MKLTTQQLNRIKIKDLMQAVYKTLNVNEGLVLELREILHRIEKRALAHATDDDLSRIEQLYIEKTLGIKYFPSQNKKRIEIGNEYKVVPIDYIYGSENT